MKATDTNKLKWKNNWVLFFVDEKSTSLICPKCWNKLYRDKNNQEDYLFHNDKNLAWDLCKEKGFEVKKSINKKEMYNWIEFKDWDDLATYNIAKKWLEYINSLK